MVANKFYILGSIKTGTSSIVGMLNCHPKIFCKYEFRLDGNETKNRRVYDTASPENNKKYLWIGDKNPKLGSMGETNKRIKLHNNYKIIFTFRELSEWLCHSSVIEEYKLNNDVVTPTIDYIYYLMKSYELQDCLRVEINDLLFSPKVTVDRIAKHFGVESKPMYKWWEKVGKWGGHKMMYKWWEGHSCATKEPTKDILVIKKSHEFWDISESIFSRWAKGKGNFEEDYYKLLELKRMSPLPLSEIIEHRTHIKISV